MRGLTFKTSANSDGCKFLPAPISKGMLPCKQTVSIT